MTDEELLRYSRHILLDEIGVEGQQRILDGRVLLIGAGGLGSPAALYLAAAGVGAGAGAGLITLVDPDTVDLTNLQRQIAHSTARVGMPKVASAVSAMEALNPGVRLRPLAQRADADLLATLVAEADVVLDCSDNYATRQAVNAACVHAKKPLVSGAVIRFDGQIAVYDPRRADSPCYACLFDPREAFEEVLCSTMGVFAPLVGIIGATQAAEALRLLMMGPSGALAQPAAPLTGRLLMLDGLRMRWSEVQVPRNPSCPICGHAHA
ncbi:molybdopterin biosynthesis protein MoeB [Hylemonella gracilis str. Niagara R]|uniref:Molybdopterin biosynthesis protein MoeB n=1 Tax=Hylemonella gracilis str. Niagara R TaxID=1458275 RepID=A0A016XL72_9BURK|nr:molybdopterin-synthase adenylyltransferase MoeB [Hylemonella gracilis]EYC52541.1 molybdopterin biosynthesis protein MoeB [Hylemonella gracilis str. Niagara R]